MTAAEFVDALRWAVLESSVRGTIAQLHSPSGRQPEEKLVEASKWFNALSEKDQAMVKGTLEMVAQHALFGLLCVLDGARTVEPAGPKGDFELRFIKNGKTDILSGPDGEVLHELL